MRYICLLLLSIVCAFSFSSCGGSILGGFFEGSSTQKPVIEEKSGTYYEGYFALYVNPLKEGETVPSLHITGVYTKNVTDTMLVLLESELFAEQVLYTMPNPPQKEIDGELNLAYKNAIQIIQQSTSFSNKNSAGVPQPNNIFYVRVSTKQSEAFAKTLYECLQRETIDFIVKNTPILKGYVGTSCELIENKQIATVFY